MYTKQDLQELMSAVDAEILATAEIDLEEEAEEAEVYLRNFWQGVYDRLPKRKINRGEHELLTDVVNQNE